MTDGVFSAEGMLVPAVLVNGRPHCPLPPRLSKSASKEKQYYCEDVAGPYYQDDGSPYQGSKLPVHYCPDITSPEAVIVAKGLNLFGKLARELDCKPMFINVAGTSGKKVMSKLDNALFFVHNEMFHMSNISTRRTSYSTGEEQTTKVTQLLDGLEERVELLLEESAPLKLKGAIESAFVDVRFKYYGSDASIKERVRALEEKQEAERKAEYAIKEEKRQQRKLAQEEKRKAELAIKEEKLLKRMRVQEAKQKAELAIKEEKRQQRKLAQEEKRKAELAIKEEKLLKQMRVQEEKQKAELAFKEEKLLKRMRVQEEKQKAELAIKEERLQWKIAQEEKWKAERAIREERLQRKHALEEKWIEERLKRIATGDRNTSAIKIASGSAGDGFPSGWIAKTYRRASGEWVGKPDRFWFSPGRNIRLRTKKHAMTFIDILKEPSVDGDEDKAAEVYKARGHKFR
jgi:hypothetical protein